MQLVSIIVCTYNGEEYLEVQLESLIQQTYPKIEILIVDDFSSDGTLNIANEFAVKHKNVTVYPFEENVGYVKNFERGMLLSRGDLIALSDQDDWWYPTKIERLVNHIGNQDLIYCDSNFVDENLNSINSSFSEIKNMVSGDFFLPFLIENCVSGHAMLLRRSVFTKAYPFPENIPHDWWITFVALSERGISYLDEKLVLYRHHQSNVIASSSKKKKRKKETRFRAIRNRIDVFSDLYKNEKSDEIEILKKVKISYQSFSLVNNINRGVLFYKHKNSLLSISKKRGIKKILYSLSFFFRIK